MAWLLAAGLWLALAGEVRVAVAANFARPAKEIAALFEKATGDRAILSFGASGPFYEQIAQGAPFQVFLSADQKRPAQAIAAGLAVKGSQFTYAIGKLALWSPSLDVSKGDEVLKAGAFNRLAIANPAAAPYGAAALEVIKALGLADALAPKIVQGATIAQAAQFVETGNAELGFVALSQVTGGTRWMVPASLYSPIKQDAVLLAQDAVSEAFLAFLKGPEARKVIEAYGYDAGP